MDEAVHLLGCEGLSLAVRGAAAMKGRCLKAAHLAGIHVMTASVTRIEAYDVRTCVPADAGRFPVSVSSR
ncbi:hypothetical protein OIE73_33540 [Streptomyces hirsutus]|uniref:Uncharacterized protein n=1 Tax=Streptomyces hirsutus TaxID=35620 RepID=A0ABZ1GVB9_9ACTN|nr:hypothetical protein [Streptomyces hirsutus]WSD10168.1 hypothetical protein OIE73_33540 [Streptomyces hirsutus]